jgi:predicted RNA binding protein YcfA (HicA-like mRNA interferase family)
MPKLPRISSREAIRSLERLGFEQVRQTGSHIVMKKETEKGEIGCVVPVHRELKIGTLDLSENSQPGHSKPSPHFLKIPKSI